MFEPNQIEKIIEEHLSKETAFKTDGLIDSVHISLKRMSNKDVELALKDVDVAKVITLRVKKLHTYRLSPKALFVISFLSKSFGVGIMYIWYLQYWSFKNNVDFIDDIMLFDNVFPNGFFSDKSLQVFWNAQKVKRTSVMSSDNLLDYYNAGESILKK